MAAMVTTSPSPSPSPVIAMSIPTKTLLGRTNERSVAFAGNERTASASAASVATSGEEDSRTATEVSSSMFLSPSLSNDHEEKEEQEDLRRQSSTSLTMSIASAASAASSTASSGSSSNSTTTTVKFDWSRRSELLCGRSQDVSALEGMYDERDQIDLVLIGGHQGVGKTTLAGTLQSRTEKDGGFFVRGRWPAVSDPHEAFGEAFVELVSQITQAGRTNGEDRTRIMQGISNAIRMNYEKNGGGFDENSLLLPDKLNVLRALIDGNHGDGQVPHHHTHEDGGRGGENNKNSNNGNGNDVRGRYQQPFGLDNRRDLFHSTIYRILKAIGSVIPVVIVLDNLHSADQSSLELLAFLCECPTLENILFVATCRGQKNERNQFLSTKMSTTMIDSAKTCIKHIDLQPLSLNGTHEFVRQLQPNDTQLSDEDCFQLSEHLYRITGGLPSLMCEVLSMMERKQMDVRNLEEPLNYDDIIFDRIQKIPTTNRHVLQVLSCLGGRNAHLSFLNDVLHPISEKELLEVIFAAKDDGLLKVHDSKERDCIHYPRLKGRVQEVVYAMMPEDDRRRTHFQIATCLYSDLPPNELEGQDRTTIIADQLILAGPALIPPDGKSRIAELCLVSARHAAHSAAFSTALSYVQYGISLLEGRTRWRDHYDLTLAMMNLTIEVESIEGNHEVVSNVHEEIKLNARCFLDTMTANLAKIGSLASRGNQIDDAINECLSVLKKLDHKIPNRFMLPRIIAGLVRTRKMLRRTSDEDILALPPLQNEKIMQVLNTLTMLFTYVLLQNSDLLPLVAMKIVDLTMQYGLSPMSPTSFGIFGLVLMVGGHREEAYRCGQLTLKLMDVIDCDLLMARGYNAAYGFLNCYKNRIADSVEPHYRAFKLNILTGDVEPAAISGSFYVSKSCLHAGCPIQDVKPQMMVILEACRTHNQQWILKFISLTAQFVANISDPSEHSTPFIISGEFMTEEEVVRDIVEDKNDVQLSWFYFIKCMMAAYIGEISSTIEAEQYARRSMKIDGKSPGFYQQRQHLFHCGLLSCSLARSRKEITPSHRRKKLLRQAKKCLNDVESFARVCPENYLNKATLLEAEIQTLIGKLPPRDVLAMYKESATLAMVQGFNHEEGLAWEKAGHFVISWMTDDSIQDLARKCFEKARAAYGRWGASVKVTAIDRTLQSLDDILSLNSMEKAASVE